jgi:hypothetical protein
MDNLARMNERRMNERRRSRKEGDRRSLPNEDPAADRHAGPFVFSLSMLKINVPNARVFLSKMAYYISESLRDVDLDADARLYVQDMRDSINNIASAISLLPVVFKENGLNEAISNPSVMLDASEVNAQMILEDISRVYDAVTHVMKSKKESGSDQMGGGTQKPLLGFTILQLLRSDEADEEVATRLGKNVGKEWARVAMSEDMKKLYAGYAKSGTGEGATSPSKVTNKRTDGIKGFSWNSGPTNH